MGQVPMESCFLSKKREDFLSNLQMKGIDLKKATEFLDTKGMYSLSSQDLLIQNLEHMADFINPLRVNLDETDN